VPGVPLVDQADLVINKIELTKNTQMNFKIKVKGEIAPLKFKLEYYDTSNKQNVSQKRLVGLKNFLELFFSKSTDTPSQVQLQIDDM